MRVIGMPRTGTVTHATAALPLGYASHPTDPPACAGLANLQLVTMANFGFAAPLANWLAHNHHMPCALPTVVHALDNATLALCNRLVDQARGEHCILADCPLCSSEGYSGPMDKHPGRSAIGEYKWYALRRFLREGRGQPNAPRAALWLDSDALVQGQHCLGKLLGMPEVMLVSTSLEGCPRTVQLSAARPQLKMNTGVILVRQTEVARSLLDHVIHHFESSDTPRYCADQWLFNELMVKFGNMSSSGKRWSVALPAIPSSDPPLAALRTNIRLLSDTVWPRMLSNRSRAYASWPQSSSRSMKTSMPSSDAAPNTICLYHPWVKGHESHADFFRHDGMWWL